MRKYGLFAGYHLLVLCVVAACDSGIRETAEVHPGETGIQRFAVSIKGDQVGYMQMEIEELGNDSLLVKQEIEWAMVLMGTRRDLTMSMAAHTDRVFDLHDLDMSMSDGTSEISVKVCRENGFLVHSIETVGRVIEDSTEVGDEYLPVLVDLACAAMEWTVGLERSFKTFDPACGAVLEAGAECLGFEDVEFLGDTVRAAKLEISQAGTRNLVWVYDGEIVREFEAGLEMELTRVPPGQYGGLTATVDLYRTFTVSSTPISHPRKVMNRTFILHGDVDLSELELNLPPVQSASGCTVRVSNREPGMTVSFPVAGVPDSVAVYLEPEPMVQSGDSLVVARAGEITAGSVDAWEAAKRISHFVDRAVENVTTISLPSAVDVLENLRGDCNEHTILFVALARAAGIPSRACAGIVYLDEAFGYHAWPMVWVGEWVAMDPTFGQYVADGTHVILATGDLQSQYVINSVIGRLSIEEITER